MSVEAAILIVTLIAAGAAVAWALTRPRRDPGLELLQREMTALREQLASGLEKSAQLVFDSQRSIGDRLDKAAEVVGRVQHSLGSLDQATEKVFRVGQDIAQLQEILRAPKLRGAMGELFLGDLLAQILPAKHYTLQHRFQSGDVVDAVVRLGRLVPVDAKFPLENFRRVLEGGAEPERAQARRRFVGDVKKHIDAIATKYLLPDEGTYDFALMYIPAENVYYETIIKEEAGADNLMAYAFTRRVVPVSPNSFYAYLQTISLGLRGLQLERGAQTMLERLDRMKNDFGRFKDEFGMLGKHIGNARNKFEEAERRLVRFEDKLIAPPGQAEVPLEVIQEEKA